MMLNKYKWYRRFKGGIWYNYYPDIHGFTHMRFWIKNIDKLANHEIVIKTENYEK